MLYPYLPLLSRLRRHRGLWVWVMTVLLLKLTTSSICLAQPPKASSVAWGHAAMIQAPSTQRGAPADAGCLLGECAKCHGACVHHLPIPVDITWVLPQQIVSFTHLPLFFDAAPPPSRSWLRPPIAAA